MDLTGIGSIADLAKGVLDKIFPDPAEKAKAQIALLQAQQAGEFKAMDQEFQLALEQIKVDAVEAANPSILVSGWRPAVGWVCVCGLAYQFIIRPLVDYVGINVYHWTSPPDLDMGTLITLLAGLLGLGGMRTAEKFKGVAAK